MNEILWQPLAYSIVAFLLAELVFGDGLLGALFELAHKLLLVFQFIVWIVFVIKLVWNLV